MKKNKGSASDYRRQDGFTLIELLVVIAIIGILSSVVLASLSSARTKAKVAAVQSTISSMRAQAEIGSINGRYVNNICTSTVSGGLDLLLKSLNKPSSKITSIGCGQDTASIVAGDTDIVKASRMPRKWAAEVLINTKYYCADSTGYSGLSVGTGLSSALVGVSGGTPVVHTAFSATVAGASVTATYSATDLECSS